MFVINTITVSGNLTRDPELRSTQSGTSVCNLSIAVNERVKKGDNNWEDYPSYIDVTAWTSLGEQMAAQLQKGSPVAITGQIRQDRWEKDGEKRSKVYIVARAFFAPKGSSDGQRFNPETDVPADSDGLGSTADDTIPF